MIRRPPRSTLDRSSAASDVYKRQGTAGTTPWERDPWVALAMKVGNHPPIVWGVCCLHNHPGHPAIRLPFWIDTGSDVTVIPETYWPIHWELEEAPMVGGVGGLSWAQKSTQLIAITLRTERGPEKTITLFPCYAKMSTLVGDGCSCHTESQSDKFSLRATAAYSPLPIKLVWKLVDPVWAEQWPLSKP